MANFFTNALKDIGILKKGPKDLQAQQQEDAEKKAAADAREIEKAKRAIDPETNRQARADEKALTRQILDTQDLQVKEAELWKKPGDQELKSPAEVRKFLLSGEHPEAYVRWVNQNVDKWMDEGKHVFVSGNSGYFAVVTDAQKKPDMAVFEEYKQLSTPKAPPRFAPSLEIGDVEEARKLLHAEIELKRASEGLPIPKGFNPELWDHIRKTNGNDLQHTLDNLDSMYQNNQRLSKTPGGDIDTTGFHQWAEKDQLHGARTAQNWISSQQHNARDQGEDAQEQAWKPLATAVPGVIRGYYESPGAVPLTVDTNGKLDVTNLVNWSRNQGGFERYNTGKATVGDKNALNEALQGLREQELVTDNSLPAPRRSVNSAVTHSADPNHFTAVYNHIEYNITINNGVATATPAAAPAAAAAATLPAGTPPATGTELPLAMTTNGTSFTADGGTVNASGQPIKLTLNGTTDGKTAIITGVTGVNTVTGVTQTLDAAEAARIINHGDMANKTAATFEVKDGKLAFKSADPHTSLEQLGADVYVAAQKQVADVNSVLEVKKGAGDAISIPANPVEIKGKNYNLTFNGTASADGKTATITNATLVDDAGKTTTIEGDKLNAVFNQKSGTAITYTIDNSSHVAINSAILPAAASTIVNQTSANATGVSTNAPGAFVNPATARPEDDKENFLEKNKFGIGAGIIGLLAGMILGGGGFMGLIIGLLIGAVALFIGGMADPNGFSHSPNGPKAALKPELAAAKKLEVNAAVQGPPAPDKTDEKKTDAPPAPSATVAQNGTQLVIDYKEQYKGDDGKMQDATLHLVGDIKDKQFIATSATVTGIDPKVPGKEIAVDPQMLQKQPISLQPINLKIDEKGAVDIKDAQQKALEGLNGKINAYRVEYLKDVTPAKRPETAPPLPAAETPAAKPDPELFKQLINNPLLSLGSLGVKSADDSLNAFKTSMKDGADLAALNGMIVNKVPELKYGGDAKEASSGLSNAANKQPDPTKTKGQQGQGQ